MKKAAEVNSNVVRIGRLIEDDIRRRGLSQGQQYLTAKEAGRAFGVSSPMASRAMLFLAERGVLVRKRGLGTFIGTRADTARSAAVQCVHLLVGEARMRAGLAIGEMTEGLLAALGGLSLQTTVVPEQGGVAMVRGLLDRAGSAGWLAGAVLVGCPREIQEAVLQSGAPVVVFGGVFATTQRLWSVDVDQHEAGRLMGSYFTRRGHQRIALLTRDLWLPGDNQLLDGINEALADAGLSQGALVLRSVPVDAVVAVAEVCSLLSREGAPTAVIARGRWFGERVQEAAEQLEMTVGEQVELISDVSDVPDPATLRWPKVSAEISYRRQAETVGLLLAECMAEPARSPQHAVIPVRLTEPQTAVAADR